MYKLKFECNLPSSANEETVTALINQIEKSLFMLSAIPETVKREATTLQFTSEMLGECIIDVVSHITASTPESQQPSKDVPTDTEKKNSDSSKDIYPEHLKIKI